MVHKVGAANGLSADLHEFLITDEGTALITVYQVSPGDVTMFRDFDPEVPEDRDPNYIWDGAFQEIDLETGDLLFEWRASDHVDITDTYRPIYSMGTRNDPFDWYHINSISKDALGNYLVSARYPHSIIYIDGTHGRQAVKILASGKCLPSTAPIRIGRSVSLKPTRIPTTSAPHLKDRCRSSLKDQEKILKSSSDTA